MIPRKQDYVFSTRLRKEDVPWWKREVDPIIKRKFGGNRTAFLMDAVRRSVTRHNEMR